MSESENEVPQADAAPLGQPGVSVTQGLPDVTMVVTNSTVSPSGDDRVYQDGETIVVDGPTAIALAAGGYARAVGPADEAPVENGAAAVEAPVEEPPAEEAPAE